MGYLYWLRVKNSNHLHTELSLGYLEDGKFDLENKASFIDISSLACFICLVLGYCDSFLASLRSSLWPKYTQLETIFQNKQNIRVPLLIFFFFNVFFIRLL